MRTDLIARFADLLEADANNSKGVKFDLSDWAHDSKIRGDTAYEDMEALRYPKTIETIPVDCGTTACALGLAAISGAFKDEGLSWKIITQGKDVGLLWPVLKRDGKSYEGFRAGEELFGIDSHTAEHLFSPFNYTIRKGRDAELEVVRRLRGLLDGTWTALDEFDEDEVENEG